jgi:hypothetical protein
VPALATSSATHQICCPDRPDDEVAGHLLSAVFTGTYRGDRPSLRTESLTPYRPRYFDVGPGIAVTRRVSCLRPVVQRVAGLLLFQSRQPHERLTQQPEVPERIAHARHSLAQELLHGKHDARSRVAHRAHESVRIGDAKLQHDRRSSERRRRVTVPRSRLLRDGEDRVENRELGVTHDLLGAVRVTGDHRCAERRRVEVDRTPCIAHDEERNEIR